MTNQRPDMHVASLVIELTRRCQFTCEHCLRGNAQNADMTTDVIDKILDSFDRITEVTFTGGEPTLNLDVMEYFFQALKARNKFIDGFYVATNGHDNQERLAHILLNAYMDVDAPEICGVSLSIDDFHNGHQSPYIRGLAFYQEVKEHLEQDPDKWVIKSGRAYDFGIGRPYDNNVRFSAEYTKYPDHSEEITADTVYVSFDGYVYPDCDLSYEIMDENKKLKIEQARPYFYELAMPGHEPADEDFLEI